MNLSMVLALYESIFLLITSVSSFYTTSKENLQYTKLCKFCKVRKFIVNYPKLWVHIHYHAIRPHEDSTSHKSHGSILLPWRGEPTDSQHEFFVRKFASRRHAFQYHGLPWFPPQKKMSCCTWGVIFNRWHVKPVLNCAARWDYLRRLPNWSTKGIQDIGLIWFDAADMTSTRRVCTTQKASLPGTTYYIILAPNFDPDPAACSFNDLCMFHLGLGTIPMCWTNLPLG